LGKGVIMKKGACCLCEEVTGYNDENPPLIMARAKIAHTNCVAADFVASRSTWPGSPGLEVLEKLSTEDKLWLKAPWVAVLEGRGGPRLVSAKSMSGLEKTINDVIQNDDTVHVLPCRGSSCSVKTIVRLTD
jgi:hypothetical protein